MSNLGQAIKILKEGGIVIYPTDTAFGMGCRIDSPKSIERLFTIRKRPSTQATPVLVSSVAMAEKYFFSPLSDNVRRVMKNYWPGALTIVYKCKMDQAPLLVRGGGKTIGLRMPNHKIPLEIIGKLGVPILGPSANFHGKATPFEYSQLDKELIKLIDYVVEGKCSIGNVSTVMDCTSIPFQIIRQGAVNVVKQFLT